MKQGFQKREKKNHAHCQIVYRSDFNFRHVRNKEKWDPPDEPRFFLYLSRKPSPSPSQLLNKRRKRSSSPVLLELLPVEDPEL